MATGEGGMSKTSVVFLFLAPIYLTAQEKLDIGSYITRIESGDAGSVREEIPSLLQSHPNDAGVLYLQGLVTTDGAEAVRVYQGVVDNFPRSDWADDALLKVYEFYYAIGLYRTAEMKWNQLKNDYPDSRHLSAGGQIQTAGLPDESPRGADDRVNTLGETAASTDKTQGQFALQVGAYSSRENAEKQKLFFEDLGYPVEVFNRLRDSRSLFLVCVGNYLTYEEAKERAADIQKKYRVDSFVVSR
jgi:tetratricopeptide (TPR) repeat protein